MGTGPSTGIGRFQRWVHQILDLDKPALGNQISNGLHPTISGEVGRSFAVGSAVLRPFVEAQAGAETLLRAGADLTVGRFGAGSLMVRDVVTGQRYSTIAGADDPG